MEDITDIVEKIKSKTFRPYTKDAIIPGFINKTCWIKFTLQSEQNSAWVLEWTNAFVEHINFYLPNNDGMYLLKKGGSQVPVKAREYATSQPTTLIKAYASEPLNRLIKQNNSIVFTPVKLKKGQKTKSAQDSMFSKYI